MIRFKLPFIFLFILCFMIINACSSDYYPEFQKNRVSGNFELSNIFEGNETLEKMWSNVDPDKVHDKLVELAVNNPMEFVGFSLLFNDIINEPDKPHIELIKQLSRFTGILLEPDLYKPGTDSVFHQYDPQRGTYSFLERLETSFPGINSDLYNIIQRTLGFMYDPEGFNLGTVEGCRDVMQFLADTADNITPENIQNFSQTIAKFLIMNDRPMRTNSSGDLIENGTYGTSIELGNTVSGVHLLLSGANRWIRHDPHSWSIIESIVNEEISDLLHDQTTLDEITTPVVATKLIHLTEDISDRFTTGGDLFGCGNTTTDYYTDFELNDRYVNSEIGNTIREIWPWIAGLFIKNADQNWFHSDEDHSVAEALAVSINEMGLSFEEDNSLENSVKKMFSLNSGWNGRDNLNDGVPYIDALLFQVSNAYTFGYKTRKISYRTNGGEPHHNPDTSSNHLDYSRLHGASTGGIITLNNVLYNLGNGSHEVLGKNFGVYDLALDQRAYPDTDYRPSQGKYIYRSSTPFHAEQRNNHNFYMGYDFPVLALLPSQAAGDAGAPDGGSSLFKPESNDTAGNDFITYYPEVSNGKKEFNTSLWIMGWIARVCRDGEGPYYHAPSDAPVVIIDGKQYYKYFRSNGKVYALVHKPSRSDSSTWEYIYPTAPGEETDNYGNRKNRYREHFESDHYLIGRPGSKNGDPETYCAPGNNYKLTDDKDEAAVFTFTESIPEKSSERECSSIEEAMIKNYQWLMTQKKFPFIIPIYVQASASLIVEITVYSPIFIIAEANGIRGISNTKKGESNGQWLSGLTGNSHLSGDGRISVYAREHTVMNMGVDLDVVWNNILGSGAILPGILAENIDPIVRMAISKNKDIIPSDVNDHWADRNRLVPVIAASIGTLWEGTDKSQDKEPLRALIEGIIMPLNKPLFVKSRDHGGRWLPRVQDSSENETILFHAPRKGDKNLHPRASLQTIMTLLGEHNQFTSDGIIPHVTDSGKLISRLFSLYAQTGDRSSTVKSTASERIYSGLEQIFSSIKSTEGEAFTLNLKNINSQKWFHQKRHTDPDLDFLAEKIPDFCESISEEQNRNIFFNSMNKLRHLVHSESEFRITEYILSVFFTTAIEKPYTDEETAGLLYTVGRLFAYYDRIGLKWVIQGDDSYNNIHTILGFIPRINQLIVEKDEQYYMDLLVLASSFIQDGALGNYIWKSLKAPSVPREKAMNDIHHFLNSDLLTSPYSELWPTLGNLIGDLGNIMRDSHSGISLREILEDYGFQYN